MNTFRWIAARKQLSPRAFKDELTSQIWFSPLIYAFFCSFSCTHPVS